MSRKFISFILAASIAVTGISLSAAPARADNDDLAKFLFGATALVIIGKAIQDNNRRDRDHVVYPTPKPKPKPKPVTRRNAKALPASCLRVYHDWDQRVRMVGKNCLQKKYRHVDRLPRQCRTQVWVRGKPARGYQMRCLRRQGYYLASR